MSARSGSPAGPSEPPQRSSLDSRTASTASPHSSLARKTSDFSPSPFAASIGAGFDPDELTDAFALQAPSSSSRTPSQAPTQRSISTYFHKQPQREEGPPAKRLKSEPHSRVPSSPGSHLTSPAASDHSSAPALTSPPPEDESLLTSGVNRRLAGFKVDSAAPSSAGSSVAGGRTPILGALDDPMDMDETQPVVAPGFAAKGKQRIQHSDDEREKLRDHNSSPPVAVGRLRKGPPPKVALDSPEQLGAIDLTNSPEKRSVDRTLDYQPLNGSPLSSTHAPSSAPSSSAVPKFPTFPDPSTVGAPPTPPAFTSPEFGQFYRTVEKSFPTQAIRKAWVETGGNSMAATQKLVASQAAKSANGLRAGQMGAAVPSADQLAREQHEMRLKTNPHGYYNDLVVQQKRGQLPPALLPTFQQLHNRFGKGQPLPKPSSFAMMAAKHSQAKSASSFYGVPVGGSAFGGPPRASPAPPSTAARPTPPPVPSAASPPQKRVTKIKSYQNKEEQAKVNKILADRQQVSPPRESPPPPPPVTSGTRNGSTFNRSVAAAASTSSSTLRKAKKKIASDSEGEGDYDNDQSEDEYDDHDTAEAAARRNELALEFFNTADKLGLTELVGCNATQAGLLIDLRPFASADDFRSKTRKQKGVGNNLFDTYLDLMEGMGEVDKILTECEAIGSELSKIMSIWASGSAAAAGVEAKQSSKENTPAPEGDVGLALVSITEDALVKTVETTTDPAVKAAFEGYLTSQPELVSKKIQLKDYQLLGVNWLNLLYSRKTSCILADEMGLGKTAQVISLLAHLKARGENGPHLVIVPSSTLENWMREFSVFAPSLNAQSYYGNLSERSELRYELREMDDLDVVVTTYNIATSTVDDQKFFKRKMHWNVAVFDEGHQLKNSESKKHKDLMAVPARWRLLLTGTPLQNNLQELVSLLSFILPDQFSGTSESLRAIFKVAPGSSGNLLSRERTSRAKKMMTPFVLRRKKAHVLKDLPNKYVEVRYCDMTDLQREVYMETLNRSKKTLLALGDADIDAAAGEDDAEAEGKPAKKGKAKAGTKSGKPSDASSSSHVLMDLRKASNHPMLFRRLYDDNKLRIMAKECLKELDFHDRDPAIIWEDMDVMTDFELHRFCAGYPKYLAKYCLKNDEWMSAGKVHALQEMLPKLQANGDRVLLFSQFTQVLDILQVVLDTMGIKWLKLTGQTSVTERQGLVDQYNEDPEIAVFLLSTRAGGLGLNLTAANTVIFMDQDYNPHNDKQAEDRAYRMGQKRDVRVIKFITRGTLEEDMLALAGTKLQLDSEVSSNTQYPSGAATAVHQGGLEQEAEDGNAAQAEKKMKGSLLSGLRKRLENEAASPTKAKVEIIKEEIKAE